MAKIEAGKIKGVSKPRTASQDLKHCPGLSLGASWKWFASRTGVDVFTVLGSLKGP